MPSTNRRILPRKVVAMDVIFEDEAGEGIIRLRAINVSLGGLFIADNIPIRVGSHAFLSFTLPDQPVACHLVGEIVRVDRPNGMGVRFVDIPQEDYQRLSLFMASA